MRISRAVSEILRALLAGKHFGWEIMQTTGLASGTVYPALKRLTEAGWIEWQWENGGRPRRCYTLTEQGRAEARKALNMEPLT